MESQPDAMFGRNLRYLREEAGLTQRQLADLMRATGYKMHQTTVAKVEAGESIDVKALIPPGHFETIVDALQQLGGETLKPVKEFLGDEYFYEEIRLVRAQMRQDT